MNRHLEVDGHLYDKINIIGHADGAAGFCALIVYALNGVRIALANNMLPVVNYDKQVNTYFYDPGKGDNVWEYYFEPVMPVSYSQVEQLLSSGAISRELIHTFPHDKTIKWHHEDPDRLATFWERDETENPAAWMQAKRDLGAEYVSRFVRVKPHVMAKVNGFFQEFIEPQYTYGIHIRGTDFCYAKPTAPKTYFDAIHQHIRDHNQSNFKLFLATDQAQFVDMFQREFGDRLITYPCIRSNSEVPAFRFQNVSPYKKGEDVLIDILLLSKCNHLFKGAAAVGAIALWFNPALEYTDFALQNQRITTYAPAYLKLNLGRMPKIRVWLLLLHKRAKRGMLDFVLKIGRGGLSSGTREWLWKNLGRHLYS